MKWWRARTRVDELRDDGVVVADDAREERVFPPQALRQVVAHLVAHRPAANLAARDGRFQLSKGVDAWRGRHISIMTLRRMCGFGHLAGLPQWR